MLYVMFGTFSGTELQFIWKRFWTKHAKISAFEIFLIFSIQFSYNSFVCVVIKLRRTDSHLQLHLQLSHFLTCDLTSTVHRKLCTIVQHCVSWSSPHIILLRYTTTPSTYGRSEADPLWRHRVKTLRHRPRTVTVMAVWRDRAWR